MISFIIPARNEEAYVGRCLDSIFSQKTARKFEVIVVDNASADGTGKVAARRPEVKLVTESVAGTNMARQRGFQSSSGDILVFLDADVRLPAGWVDRVMKKLDSNPEIIAISGPYRYYDYPWLLNFFSDCYTIFVALPWQVITKIFSLPSFMIGGNMTIRRASLESVGGFDTNLKFYGDDTDTGRRLHKIGRSIFSFRFWVYSSARRYRKIGLFKAIVAYLRNYFSLIFRHKIKDSNTDYEEIR